MAVKSEAAKARKREYYRLWRDNNRERYNKGRREWAQKNKEKQSKQTMRSRAKRRLEAPEYIYRLRRNQQLKADHGITLADYEAMLEKQGGVCMICHTHPKPGEHNKYGVLAVDHDHITGAIRGLLCQKCNICIVRLDALGREWAENAMKYLGL